MGEENSDWSPVTEITTKSKFNFSSSYLLLGTFVILREVHIFELYLCCFSPLSD